MIVLLDSGPLGFVTNPRGNQEAQDCKNWLAALVPAGHLALVPEIIDYEHRRELLLVWLSQALMRLDAFKDAGAYLPVTEEAYLQAAQFWAAARKIGMPTADRLALDADVILCAQASTLDPSLLDRPPNEQVVIATTNVGHLSRFVSASLWRDIS
jgi:hypothetical protein